MDLLISLCILLERLWWPQVEAAYTTQTCCDLLLRLGFHTVFAADRYLPHPTLWGWDGTGRENERGEQRQRTSPAKRVDKTCEHGCRRSVRKDCGHLPA